MKIIPKKSDVRREQRKQLTSTKNVLNFEEMVKALNLDVTGEITTCFFY